MPVKKPGLLRSREQSLLFGVCGGLAEWLGWNATLVRLLFVTVSVASAAFPGIIVYLVMWVLMPLREREPAYVRDGGIDWGEDVESMARRRSSVG